MRTINKYAVALGLFLGVLSLSLFAQTASQGGSFLPTQDYTVTGRWTMSGGVALSGTSTIASGMTISAPVLSGSVTGTYTLAGTPTITSPAITGATLTTSTYNGNTWTAGTGVLTIAAAKTLTANNSLTLAGTDTTTMTFPAISSGISPVVAPFQTSASLGSSPVTLTAAQCGGSFNLDAATGVVYILPSTLPAVGCTYDFRVTVSVTSNAHEIESGNAAHFFTGDPIMVAAAATLASGMCDGSSAIAYKSNGTTTGGLIGSRYRVTVLSSTLLLIEGINAGSGSLSTACSASN